MEMNRRDALKAGFACALTAMLPLNNIEADETEQFCYAVMNGKKLKFKDVKVGDCVEIWDKFGTNYGSMLIAKSPYLKDIEMVKEKKMAWTLEGQELNTNSKAECNSALDGSFLITRQAWG